MVAPVLAVKGVSKTFVGTTALDQVSLEILPGEVHALVGENGSGKSTLVKILAGYHQADAGGSIEVGGGPYAAESPTAASNAGLRFVHQDLGLVNELDCLDNMALGHGYQTGLLGRIKWRQEAAAARKSLERLGYPIDVRRHVGTLAMSERTALAIARALSPRRSEAKVLVLDEPTVNLTGPEVEHLFELLRRITATGVAILFISHHFNEIFEFADRVTVLRDGRLVDTREVSSITEHDLVELMIGRPLELTQAAAGARSTAEPILRVRGLAGSSLKSIDLDVSPGEVVGIAGITGSGREELALLLIGAVTSTAGSVEVNGKELPQGRPDVAWRSGVALVPAERSSNGTLPDHNVRENATISSLSSYRHGLRLRRSQERSDVATLLDTFDVRPRNSEVPITSLSGGNQQKVMLLRALRLRLPLLVLDEPTQGVDVGAQAEIHRLIRESAHDGLAVVVCSSSSEELAELADRVVVLAGGHVAGEMHAPLDPDRITGVSIMTR
jgi:ribose transport system ATP-binding protein